MAHGGVDSMSLGFNASGPIVQYAFVKMVDADTVGPVTAEGDLAFGVAQYPVGAAEITRGKGCTTRVDGISLCKVGTGGVTVGTIVVIDGAGLIVASNSGARPVGVAMDTGVAGDLVPVLLADPGLPLIP